jgi:glycosyltransferase involved in cell wall biosynthesis
MKVAYLGPKGGGIRMYTGNLMSAISRLYPDVDISYHGTESYNDFDVSELLDGRPDVVHVQMGECSPVQNIVGRLPQDRLAFTLHEIYMRDKYQSFQQRFVNKLGSVAKARIYDTRKPFPNVFWKAYRFTENSSFRRNHGSSLELQEMAKRIFVLSEFAKKELELSGIDSVVVPHPPNIPRHPMSERDRAAVRGKYGITERTILGNPGYYPSKWKDYEILSKSLKHLGDVDVDILVVGNNFSSLGFRSREAGKAKIRFVSTGEIPERELSFLFQSVQALALAYEPGVGFCQSGMIPVAMDHGLPIVGTPAGSIGEYVKDGGIVVPRFGPREMAEGIRTVMADEGVRREMGRKAADRAKCLSWLENAKTTLGTYEGMMD